MKKSIVGLLACFAALSHASAPLPAGPAEVSKALRVLHFADLAQVKDATKIARAIQTLRAARRISAEVATADLALLDRVHAIPPGPAGLSSSQANQTLVGQAIYNYPVYLAGSNSTWQTTVQAVLNTAGTSGGGNVFLPGVQIPLTSSLTVASNVHIKGVSPAFNWAAGGQIPDALPTRTTGTWFYSSSASFPAIAYNNVDRVNWGYFLPSASSGTSTASQYVWNSSNLSNGQQILVLTNASTPQAQVTVSTVNSHQSITLSAAANIASNANYLLPQGTVVSGSGATWTMSSGSLAYVSPHDVLVDGSTLNTATVSSVNGNVVTFSAGATFTASGNFYLLVHPSTPPDPTWINQGIVNFSIEDCGFDTFTQAIQMGGRDSPGMWYGGIRHVYVLNCSSWGVNLNNCQHIQVEGLWIYQCSPSGTTGELRVAADNSSTFLPGNSSFKDVFVYSNNSYLSKGIVCECFQQGCGIGSQDFFHVQSNRYSTTMSMQTVTAPASGSANPTQIPVSNTSLFCVGLPLIMSGSSTAYTAPANFNSGIAAGQVVVVTSVGSNYITVAYNRAGVGTGATSYYGTDIASNNASGGTVYLFSHGMPLLEFTGYGSAKIGPTKCDNVDLESNSCAAVYDENSTGIQVNMSDVGTPGYGGNMDTTFCLRGAWYSNLSCLEAAVIDMDGNSASFPPTFLGTLGTTSLAGMITFSPVGYFFDGYNQTWVLNLSSTSGTTGNGFNVDLQNRNVGGIFSYPNRGIGVKLIGSNLLGNNANLNGSDCGLCVASSSSTGNWTWSLPSIASSTTAQNTWNTGLHFYIENDLYGNSANTLTVSTQGTSNSLGWYGSNTTTCVIPLGGYIEVVAANTSGGGGTNYYWSVVGHSSGVTWSNGSYTGSEFGAEWAFVGLLCLAGKRRRTRQPL